MADAVAGERHEEKEQHLMSISVLLMRCCRVELISTVFGETAEII